jgi:glycogenin
MAATKVFSTNGEEVTGTGLALLTTRLRQPHIRQYLPSSDGLSVLILYHRYAPAYERFGSQISAIHFIGPDKPWNSLAYRAPFTNQSSPSDSPQRAYDYSSLLDRWYSVYDKHYRSEPTVAQPAFELKRYESAWNETLEQGKQAALPAGSTLSLEELRKLAIEGMKASPPTFDDKSGEGDYQSMPLNGRIDLMRPKKTEDTVPQTQENAKPKEKKKPPMLQNLSDSEELPLTPIPPQIHLQPASPPRWHILATPAPDELPPSPRLKNISLPATPTPQPLPQRQPPVTQHQALPRPDESQKQREQPGSQQPEYLQPEQQHQGRPEQQHQERHFEPPPRPRSPPLLIWNPAVEPPPTATPTQSAFPSDTYFPNVWDQTPSKQHDQSHQQGTSPTPDSGTFFQAPPPAEIPEILLRQGHYRNVTGESSLGSPSPDRAKVKNVFPWEEKPRHMPGRVFPLTDSPTPSLFLSPESQTSSSEVPTTPERKTTTPVLSPLSGLPFTLTYTNAWDTVPSIQKYASRLVRPPAPRPLAPAFDEDGWEKRKSWDDKAEASSRDGDVEDEGDESVDEHAPSGSLWDDDSDGQTTKVSRRPSRRGSNVSATDAVRGKRQYREFGVQTIPRETKNQSVQVNTIHSKTDKSSDSDRKPSMSSKGHWAPSGRNNAPPSVTAHAVNVQTELSSVSHSGMQGTASQLLSPTAPPSHTFPPTTTAPPSTKVITSPLKATTRSSRSSSVILQQTSNDSSQGSSASSLSPLSPPDGQPISSPLRKAGRVWDPARGVELFKRGSEEVLARFLKMGSWEEENR